MIISKKTLNIFLLSFFTCLIIYGVFVQTAFAYDLIATPKGPAARSAQSFSGNYKQFEEFGNLTAEIRPLYTTVDNPSFHIVGFGGPLAGVGDAIITTSRGTFRCTAALLPTGQHVLTAGHCITNNLGNVDAISGTVKFNVTGTDAPISITTFTKHPAWNGDLFRGNDLAVLTLSSIAPSNVPRYDIDRTPLDDLNTIVDKVGYGKSGTGNTGATLLSGTKREGMNRYDALADVMLIDLGRAPGVGFVPGSVLQYDFDNGLVQNDAFNFFFGIPNLGLGVNEVLSAPGDSGGPSFSNNVITGITSYGVTLHSTLDGSTSDVNTILDSSFGEFGGDTRVSSYTSFVDSIVPQIFCGRSIASFTTVIIGTLANDKLIGTSGDDLIDGKEGNDSIKGNGGNDCLIGGLGNDRISGGLGDDETHGGDGIDHITGRDGNDILFGEEGNDIISGGVGNDSIDGGNGDDIVLGREGDDTMSGGSGNDSCIGETGTDTTDVSCEVSMP